MFQRWYREPLLHFLLLGALLFLIFALLNKDNSNNNTQINISQQDINHLGMLWHKKRQRHPTQDELNGLIEQQIREEVLYREALKLGLEQKDSIVRRRLAQKVEFLFADIATLVEPTDKELTEYLATHPDQFVLPGRITFQQIYFNPDSRGNNTQKDANTLLNQLAQTSNDINVSTSGDRFMPGTHFQAQTQYDVTRIFGKPFSSQLFSLSVGKWQGPIKSGYGMHLILIEKQSANQLPELAQIKDKVLSKFIAEQRRKANSDFYQSLRQRYEINIDNNQKNNTVNLNAQNSNKTISKSQATLSQ